MLSSGFTSHATCNRQFCWKNSQLLRTKHKPPMAFSVHKSGGSSDEKKHELNIGLYICIIKNSSNDY